MSDLPSVAAKNPPAQELAFLNGEADAWIRRNPSVTTAASNDHPILSALREVALPERGRLIDIGGAAGAFAEGFRRHFQGWQCEVLEPSPAAVEIGRGAFPELRFHQQSIATLQTITDEYDLVTCSAVLHWIDRALLSRAVANIDGLVVNGGLLVVHDFDPPHPRANRYVHRPGVFTYKQDYTACFVGLGIYHPLLRRSIVYGTAADTSDPYDRQWVTSIVRKDLWGRYAQRA